MSSRPHLRAVPAPAPDVVPDPAAADDHEPTGEPTGLLADALADAPPGGGGLRHLETVEARSGLLAETLSRLESGLGLQKDREGEPFLRLVEAAEKVIPLGAADGDSLAPSQLLDMLRAAGERPLTPDEAEKAELLKRLRIAAWDVVRSGVAEDDPELDRCLVHICNHVQAEIAE